MHYALSYNGALVCTYASKQRAEQAWRFVKQRHPGDHVEVIQVNRFYFIVKVENSAHKADYAIVYAENRMLAEAKFRANFPDWNKAHGYPRGLSESQWPRLNFDHPMRCQAVI